MLGDEQAAAVGEGARRFPVVATVNGYSWRTSLARMGGEFLVGLRRQGRQDAGVQAGDAVAVTLELDTGPREVAVPEPLRAALAADPAARAAFGSLSHSRRRECASWIAGAKKEETRRRRVAETMGMLTAGRPQS